MPADRHPRPVAGILLLVLLLGLSLLGPVAPAVGQVPSDELDPAEDNADPASKVACADQRSVTGSLITRRLINGPRRADGSLAFVSGVCVYLPPGYDANGLRYPVLYLLHGAFGWQHDWVAQGGMQQVMDDAFIQDQANAMIVVMPDGTYDAKWADDPSGYPRNETYVFDHVIPYVDSHFRTIADRSGRAISGLSNGGAGTLRLAAKRPDSFAVATAMSAALPVNMAAPTSVQAVANDPTEIADNLDNVELALIWGQTCGTPAECQQYGFAWGFENACCNNELYVARLEHVVNRPTPFTYEATVGGHDWRYWTDWLRAPHGPFIREHLADPAPAGAPLAPAPTPGSFRYRTIRPEFSIYGYDVAVEGRPAAEFLALTAVTRDGLTLRGSGTVQITTPPRYTPGTSYSVAGTGADAAPVVADQLGRLSFDVDLGPGHTADQYTPQAVAAEAAAAGEYWTTRTVTITPVLG
jgi:S-formylglutathione hydrolase FrmB